MIWRLIFIVILIMCFAGASLRNNEFSEGEFINLTNKMEYNDLNLAFNQEGNDEDNPFVSRVIYKAADFFGFVWLEGMKVSMIFGYYNPQYNFELAWKLMFATIIAALVIPFSYILLFAGYGIVQLVNIIKGRKKNVKKNTRHNN